MRQARNIVLLMVVLVVIAALTLRLMPSGKPPVHLAAESCDARLWNHVYLPDRLRVIDPCVAVQGLVKTVQPESDGDIHIRLHVEEKRALNLVNRLHMNGDLIVEAICEHTSPGANATAACKEYSSQVRIPNVGDRVRVTGSLVVDSENRWNEIHPVTKIEILH